jgi:hypothetical protein
MVRTERKRFALMESIDILKFSFNKSVCFTMDIVFLKVKKV